MTGTRGGGSGSRDKRAQTTQDFVIGIGIFLLAVAFVFSFLPSLLSPYAPGVDDGDAAQADRVAGEIMETVGTEETNEINASMFESEYVDKSSNALAGALGLRSADGAIDRVNITIERLNQSEDRSERVVLGGGDPYAGGSGASSAQIVRVDNLEAIDGLSEGEADELCDPACRLVVRIW